MTLNIIMSKEAAEAIEMVAMCICFAAVFYAIVKRS